MGHAATVIGGRTGVEVERSRVGATRDIKLAGSTCLYSSAAIIILRERRHAADDGIDASRECRTRPGRLNVPREAAKVVAGRRVSANVNRVRAGVALFRIPASEA